jgi:hypothetical protein
MKGNKHIQSFNEHQENLNISDVSRSSCRFLTDEDYINVDNLDEDLKGEWAIFRVSGGKKFYISSLYKENLNWNETKLTYSDKSTLKLTKEFATKVGLINKERFIKYIGIVNDKGLQEIL